MDKKKSELLKEALKIAKTEIEISIVANDAITSIAGLENELESSLAIIDEQAAQLEVHKLSNPNYRPSLKIKTDEFRINHAVRGANGNIVTITELAENPKLVVELHKSGSTAVTLLPKEKV